MNPKVSIVIATYNSEKTIRNSLNSVLNQNFIDWECIVVDGLSHDNTISIVKEFCNTDARFRYISEKDNGIYDAFNKGWRIARGEWVHYLGSDDTLTKESFSELLKQNHPDVAIISGHCFCIKSDGTVKPNFSVQYAGCHQGKLTRRRVIESLGGFDEKIGILADMDLILKIQNDNLGVDVVDSFVAYFAMGGVSQKFSSIVKLTSERYRIYKKYPKLYSFPFLYSLFVSLKQILSIIYRKIKSFCRFCQ